MSKQKKKVEPAEATPPPDGPPPPKPIGTIEGVQVFSGARAPRAAGRPRIAPVSAAATSLGVDVPNGPTPPWPSPEAIVTPPAANGASNGHANGHANGSANGHANGHAPNGQANGHANGATNGHANGHSNGSANGHANGAPHVDPIDADAAAVNAFHQRLRDRDDRRWDKTQAPIPQGTTEAIQLWDITCRVREIPAEACNLWVKQVASGVDSYDFLIDGRAVGGADPGRALYEHMRSARRCPTKYEDFDIRIEAPADGGKLLQLGSGRLRLAPEVTQQSAFSGAWGSGPGAPGTVGNPAAGGGLEMMLPFLKGMPPMIQAMLMSGGGAGAGMLSWLLPVMMMQGGGGGGWWGGAKDQAAPPKAVAADPAMLEIWKLLRDSTSSNNNAQTALLTKLMDRLLVQPEPEKKGDDLERVFGFVERIRGLTEPAAAPEKKTGLTIHTYNGAAIVERPDGTIDSTMSAVLSLKDDVKDMIKSRTEATAAAIAMSTATAPRMGK